MEYQYLLGSDGLYLLDTDDLFLQVYSFNLNPYKIEESEYLQLINSGIIQPIFNFFVLNDDETVKEDLTKYVKNNSGELTINYANGTRRNLTLDLCLPTNKLPINPSGGILWKGRKFKLEIGLKTPTGEYLKPAGVFILSEFSTQDKYNHNVVTLNMVDKFGALDGTVGGTIVDQIDIPRGSSIKDVIKSLLLDKKLGGVPYDLKRICFSSGFANMTTPYTISKTSGNTTIGSTIIELAEIVGYEVYYNEYGNLVFEDSADSMTVNTQSSIWSFTKGKDMANIQAKSNPQEVYNIVIVEGGNINGALMDATAKNTNPKSPTNITLWEPKVYKIQDENISSAELAQKRADYELFKKSIFQFTLTFNSVFLPHLDVNKVVTINDNYIGYNNTRCLINSITIPIGSLSQFTISAKNIEEVAFNG